MKVYQINVVCGTGSTGKIAVDLAEKICQEGGSCRIAYGRGNSPQAVDSFRISNKVDLYIHALLTRLTDKHGLYSKRATKRLINDIKAYNPDIIQLHNIHGYYLNYEMLFQFLANYEKPVVWTLHDCWAFTGHCSHFDYIGCEKWKDMCFECPQKKEYPQSMLLDNSRYNHYRKKLAFNLPDNMTIVTVSNWLKEMADQSLLKKYPIETIYNGIDLSVMYPIESDIRKQYGLENKKIILGVASVWTERKGVYSFYQLAECLPECYQIVMIGLNKHQIKEKPKKVIGIEKTLTVQELAKWYSCADLFVNASVEETMGLTTVEAMACGTPVVVMNRTASPELVSEGCGMIVDPESLNQLRDAVTKQQKSIEISRKCIAHAQKFEKEKQYGLYLQLYHRLMGDKK